MTPGLILYCLVHQICSSSERAADLNISHVQKNVEKDLLPALFFHWPVCKTVILLFCFDSFEKKKENHGMVWVESNLV